MNRLKLCKTCGASIAIGAKVCPFCGAKQRTGTHPVVIVVGVVLALGIIGAIFGGSDEPEKVGTVGSVPSAQLAGEPSASPTDSPAAPQTTPPEETTTFGVGDIVALHDVNVTLAEVTENYGSQFNTPSDGHVFVLFRFEIDNQSDSDLVVSSLLSVSAYFDDYATSLSLGAVLDSELPQLDGTVAPGKKLSGVVGYEVPADWTNAEVHLTLDYWSDRDIIFTYTK